MKHQLIAAALVAAFCSTAQANVDNLVINGSFEANSQADGTWSIYKSLTGWFSHDKQIELRNNVAGTAFDGSNYIELDAKSNSDAYQKIQTVLGQSYDLSFAYSPRENVSAKSNGIEVLWNGKVLEKFTGTGAPSGNHWTLEHLTVLGTGHHDRLEFRAIGTSDSYGGSLDAVRMTAAVPEPETYAMMLAGLGMMGFIARRRKNKVS